MGQISVISVFPWKIMHLEFAILKIGIHPLEHYIAIQYISKFASWKNSHETLPFCNLIFF